MDLEIREADGVKIRFAEAGHGCSETAVLTSPWPESLLAFRKIWDRLAERFHPVAIDLPGFGQSERQLDLLSPPAMGAFLLELVREWDLGPPSCEVASQQGGPPARRAFRMGRSARPVWGDPHQTGWPRDIARLQA